jgi:RimJ/RimL family protein N-acetyltransferase
MGAIWSVVSIDEAEAITARPATIADARYVWTVNNDPSVRAQSLRTDDIPWDDHVGWYRGKLESPDCGFLIGLERDKPVGVARFDVSEGEATVSIAVSPEHQSRGVGKRLVEIVTRLALARPDVGLAVAYTRRTNLASQRVFLGNGYRCAGSPEMSGIEMFRFVRPR